MVAVICSCVSRVDGLVVAASESLETDAFAATVDIRPSIIRMAADRLGFLTFAIGNRHGWTLALDHARAFCAASPDRMIQVGQKP
jgi:hypothetical protein